MAHIFSLAAAAAPAYHEGSRDGNQVKFPDTGFFQGFNKPSRLEAVYISKPPSIQLQTLIHPGYF
jgi:hypothetical protein